MDDDGFFDEPFGAPARKPFSGYTRRASRTVTVPSPTITLSDEMQSVLTLLEDTSQNLFLTGRAGTGKSTLLSYFRSTTKKNIAVVAPTGVAAVNVQGETIHRFFGFGIGVTIDSIKKVPPSRRAVYAHLDVLVIDEISMVRADLFDCIDRFLRLNGRDPLAPFGGVQLLLVGDLYQLPPVVTAEERGYFSGYYYPSPYFFDAHAYAAAHVMMIELTQVYRQNDPDFIAILDAVRTAQVTDTHLTRINARVTDIPVSSDDFHVSLVARNVMAEQVNARHLARLTGEVRRYRGMTAGDFRDKDLPTALELELKEGAQVMLLHNDQRQRWVNGDLARIVSFSTDTVRVVLDDGREEEVSRVTWEKVQFVFNEETERIEPTAAGSFTQLPLKLAWAVTMHKGQGKTYDQVVVDFSGGMFAPGQAYVALSRCRSLDGLTLTAPLQRRHVFTDPRIDAFMAGRDEDYLIEPV